MTSALPLRHLAALVTAAAALVACGDDLVPEMAATTTVRTSTTDAPTTIAISSTTVGATTTTTPPATTEAPAPSTSTTTGPASTTTSPASTTTFTTTPAIEAPPLTALPEGDLVDGSYADPRGGLFAEFQRSFDRTGRFAGLDAFCHPADAPPASDPVDVEPGISAEAITVVHVATRLDELPRVGFGVPVGDVDGMVRAFVDLVNGPCGGIHGRTLDLRTVEVSALGGGGFDIDTLREAACLEAVEVYRAVVVLAVTPIPGTAAGCLGLMNRTAHLTTAGVSDRDLVRAGGLVQSLEVGDRSGLRLAVLTALNQGLLDGATIGIVLPDAPQRSDDLVAAVVGALEGTDLEPTTYQIGCEGTTTCRVGLTTAVGAMIDEGVDVVVPLLDMTSLPWLVLEMLDQGMPNPLFVQSGLDGQGLDAVAARVAEFGGTPAGDFYDGALVVDASATGAQRLDDAERRPFDRLCALAWAEATGSEVPLVEDPVDDVHRSVVEACSLVRWLARAVDDAGPDPSLLGLQVSLANVGPLDVPNMRPTTVDDRHLRTLQVRSYQHPCRVGVGFGESDGCLVPVGPPVVMDRSGMAVTGLEPPRLPPDEVRVFVTNGSGLGGVAGLTTGLLKDAGYDTARPGNAGSVVESFAYYRPGHLGDARGVREVVSPYLRVEPMPSTTNFVPQRSVARVRSADVVVVIGADLARRLREAG